MKKAEEFGGVSSYKKGFFIQKNFRSKLLYKLILFAKKRQGLNCHNT